MNVARRIKALADDMYEWTKHAALHVVAGNRDRLNLDIQCAKPKVYIYDLPARFRPTHRLALVSETYWALYDFFRFHCRTTDPGNADFFFVPLNLIQFQFRNKDPSDVLDHLEYYDLDRCDHLLVALGDFSQRSKKNHFGHAYLETYDWLDNFILLALESTNDLVPDRDIGIIPFNTLSDAPACNVNERPLLYSFIGELSHVHLPSDHIRSRVAKIPSGGDVFIGSEPPKQLAARLNENYGTRNAYELLARNSVFTLAPAGYGRWTYRFFQAIQWGSIPVLLSDDYIKPFESAIPYDTFCITLAERDVGDIDRILRSIPPSDVATMQNALKENQRHFTKAAFFNELCNSLRRIQGNPSSHGPVPVANLQARPAQ